MRLERSNVIIISANAPWTFKRYNNKRKCTSRADFLLLALPQGSPPLGIPSVNFRSLGNPSVNYFLFRLKLSNPMFLTYFLHTSNEKQWFFQFF